MTSIGWRLHHIAGCNWIYVEHAFGRGRLGFPDLQVHGTADAALRDWQASREALSAWLDSAEDADLIEDCPTPLGGPLTASEIVRILVDEQTHHGAEIALLRDLCRRRHSYRAGPPR
ncbi:MAG: DinB family protein [Micropruina sp.]|uniref:DinB family protein n=1 Tax=Micropruina sp. TaxID=2737536 RepID=UPI0039E3022E